MRRAQEQSPAAWAPALSWSLALAFAALGASMLWRQVLQPVLDVDAGVVFGAGVLTLGFVSALAGAWLNGLRGVGLDQVLAGLLSVACFYRGIQLSAAELFNMSAVPWHTAAMAALAYALNGPWHVQARPPRPQPNPGPWALALALAVLAILQAAAILQLRGLFFGRLDVHESVTSNQLFYFPRAHTSAIDVSGRPFVQTGLLLGPVLYAAVLALVLRYLLAAKAMSGRRLAWWLFGLALALKWVTASLSSDGLGIIAIKIRSINTNYFALAKAASAGDGIWAFLKDHHLHQAALGAHGDTHPPGPVLFYWLLSRFLGWNAGLHGVAFQAITALAVIPISRIAERAYGSRDAGIAAAVLFLSSPLSAILSGAGIDALVLLAGAVMAWKLLRAVDEDDPRQAAWAALAAFLASLLSYGSTAMLAFAGILAAAASRRRHAGTLKALGALLLHFGIVLGGLLLLHLAFKAMLLGHYNYLSGSAGAHFAHRNANAIRSYELWSWGNVGLYAGYAGAGLLGAWMLRAFSVLWNASNDDLALPASLALILFLIFAAMGRGEVQREFLFGGLCLAVPAGRALLSRDARGGLRGAWPLFALAAALNLAAVCVLQVHVLDFW